MAKSELTIEERVEQLEKKLNDAEAKLRRYSENWKNFCKIHLGSIAKDGKLGYTNVKLLGVLGLVERAGDRLKEKGVTGKDIQDLIRKREEFRDAGKYAEADAIRDQLKEKSITLEDTPRGVRWKIKL